MSTQPEVWLELIQNHGCDDAALAGHLVDLIEGHEDSERAVLTVMALITAIRLDQEFSQRPLTAP